MKSSFLILVLSICLLGNAVGCHNADSPVAEPEAQASDSHTSPSQSSAGFRPGALGMTPALLTKRVQLDQHIGQLVAIRGTVSNSKIATIIGVDVDADFELRGKECYAVGILAKWTSTQQQLDELFEKQGPVATRGPGTSYTLYSDLSGKVAEARAWPNNSDANDN